jgi:hypothetical protein
MSTTTATIFIGHAHPKDDGGIQASPFDSVYGEQSASADSIPSLEEAQEPLVMNSLLSRTMIDDIYLMICQLCPQRHPLK